MTVQSPSSSVLDLLDCPATSFLRSFHAFLSMTEFDWDYGGRRGQGWKERFFAVENISPDYQKSPNPLHSIFY